MASAQRIVERSWSRSPRELQGVWRCGWCKGFLRLVPVFDTQRWVHADEPMTKHEVLPYREG